MKMQIGMKMQGSKLYIFHFHGFWSSHLFHHFYSNITFFFSITNCPNSLVSTWSWSCLKISMGFTSRLHIYLQFNWVCSLVDKISNFSIGSVPAMAKAIWLSRVVSVLIEILNPWSWLWPLVTPPIITPCHS